MDWREAHLRCHKYCLSQPNPPKKCHHWAVDDDEEIKRKMQAVRGHILHEELRFFRMKPDCFTNLHIKPLTIKLFHSVNEKFCDRNIEEDPTVIEQTQIKSRVSNANRYTDPTHVDFLCPRESCTVRTAYSSLLDNELILRKMYSYCALLVEVKQKYLKLSIQNGQEVINMRRAINHWCNVGEEEKMMDVNDAVLCILHLELRCTENKIGHLFNDGFSHRKQAKMVTEYTDEIEEIVNKRKVGLSTHQNQWWVPIDKAKDGVASYFSLKGNAGKKILLKVMKLYLWHYHVTVLRTKMSGRKFWQNTSKFLSSSTGAIPSPTKTLLNCKN